MDKQSKIKSLIYPMEDLYDDIFNLKAMLTVFAEALHRFEQCGTKPSDNTLIPCYADMLENAIYDISDKYKKIYDECCVLHSHKEVKANE